MVAFLAVSIFVTIRVIFLFYSNYQRVYPPSGGTVYPVDDVLWFTLAIMILVIVFQGVLGFLGYKAWNDFGWKLYKTVGANKNLIGIVMLPVCWGAHFILFFSVLPALSDFPVVVEGRFANGRLPRYA